MKKTVVLFVGLFLISYGISIGQNDAYKAFLKHTSVVIHKAQKQMLVSGKNDAGGLLAKSVLLQCHAVKLYGQKNEALSVSSSAKARELAAEIIKNMGGKENTYYLISDEEKKLISDKTGESELLKVAKKNLGNLPENDKDFSDPKSLNFTNIDIK